MDPWPLSVDHHRVSTLSDVIAGAVRAERARRKWSQAELARRTGMSRSTIGDIEQGKRQVTANHLPLFCQALGVPLSVLMHGADPADLEALRGESRSYADLS